MAHRAIFTDNAVQFNIVNYIYQVQIITISVVEVEEDKLTFCFSSLPSLKKKSLHIYIYLVSAREAELRRLRKANVEFEEQNAVLQRHIKDMYNAKERLEAELGQDELRTQALHKHLLAIKHTLVNSLSSVALPGQQTIGFIQAEGNGDRETDKVVLFLLDRRQNSLCRITLECLFMEIARITFDSRLWETLVKGQYHPI